MGSRDSRDWEDSRDSRDWEDWTGSRGPQALRGWRDPPDSASQERSKSEADRRHPHSRRVRTSPRSAPDAAHWDRWAPKHRDRSHSMHRDRSHSMHRDRSHSTRRERQRTGRRDRRSAGRRDRRQAGRRDHRQAGRRARRRAGADTWHWGPWRADTSRRSRRGSSRCSPSEGTDSHRTQRSDPCTQREGSHRRDLQAGRLIRPQRRSAGCTPFHPPLGRSGHSHSADDTLQDLGLSSCVKQIQSSSRGLAGSTESLVSLYIMYPSFSNFWVYIKSCAQEYELRRPVGNKAEITKKPVVAIAWENMKNHLSHRVEEFEQLFLLNVCWNASNKQTRALWLFVCTRLCSANINNSAYNSVNRKSNYP